MSRTTSKTGITGKVLVLLASLSMLFAGLTAVALAPAASATPSLPVRICHVNAPNGVGSATNPYQNIEPNDSSVNEIKNPNEANGHGTHTGGVFDPSKSKFDQESWGDIIPPFDYTDEYGSHTFPGLNWTNNPAGQAIWNNGCNVPAPKLSASGLAPCLPADGSVDITWSVKNESAWTVDISASGVTPAKREGVAPGATVTFTQSVSSTGDKTTTFTASYLNGSSTSASGTVTIAGCTRPPVLSGSVLASDVCAVNNDVNTWTVTWTVTNTSSVPVSVSTPDGLTRVTAAGPTAAAGQVVFTKAVTSQAQLAPTFVLSAEGSTSVNVVGTYTPSGTCTPPPCVGDSCNPQSFSATATAGSVEELCFNDTTVSVSASGSGGATSTVSETEAQGAAQAIANANANADMAAKKGQYPGATSGACLPATVTAALPATVVPAEKPAKKPVIVSAPKPAKVTGGVANTVSVPEAATVPAAVPAGDGSQAPGLPMWALAFIVVGALGAAAAGKQILGARS